MACKHESNRIKLSVDITNAKHNEVIIHFWIKVYQTVSMSIKDLWSFNTLLYLYLYINCIITFDTLWYRLIHFDPKMNYAHNEGVSNLNNFVSSVAVENNTSWYSRNKINWSKTNLKMIWLSPFPTFEPNTKNSLSSIPRHGSLAINAFFH